MHADFAIIIGILVIIIIRIWSISYPFLCVSNPLVVVNKQHGVNVKHQEYFADSPSIGMDPASRDEWVLGWIYARSLNIINTRTDEVELEYNKWPARFPTPHLNKWDCLMLYCSYATTNPVYGFRVLMHKKFWIIKGNKTE